MRNGKAFCLVLQIVAMSWFSEIATAANRYARESPPTELIILFDPLDSSSPTEEQISAAIGGDPQYRDLLIRLGRPTGANYAIPQSYHAPIERTALGNMAARQRLGIYLVLAYADSESADSAERRLIKDPSVSSIDENLLYDGSASPSDRYFFQTPAYPTTDAYQWGTQLLNFENAWDKERGTAYLAAADRGVNCGAWDGKAHAYVVCSESVMHPDLKQNFRLQFSKAHQALAPQTNDFLDHCYSSQCVEGHGMHVLGLLGATPEFGEFSNGQVDTGVAGACWTCSLAMQRIDVLSDSVVAAALTYAADHGMEVVNMSFGSASFANCTPAGGFHLRCDALAYARDRDVVLVAASGNDRRSTLDWPARSSDTIAVGGVEYPGEFWKVGYPQHNPYTGIYDPPCTTATSNQAECGSNFGTQDDGTNQIVAPAKDVVSTIYLGTDYNNDSHCGDSWGAEWGVWDGYGSCTGTSMSTPIVAGLVGLVRSANPLLSRQAVKSIVLNNTVACAGAESSRCGAGYPDANKAVAAALGGALARNRVTPLFSFYSSVANDHFYTIVPQMAGASLNPGDLLPQPASSGISYSAIGQAIPNYLSFPIPANCVSPCLYAATPLAIASVFTSHVDPQTAGAELLPLYRLSWACTGSCTKPPVRSPTHISHYYTTSASEVAAAKSNGYALDGIEGYVFPKTKPHPIGAVKLCRMYSAARDDYILFSGPSSSGAACATTDGYTLDGSGILRTDYSYVSGGTDWLGWVYPVQLPRPVFSAAYAQVMDFILQY